LTKNKRMQNIGIITVNHGRPKVFHVWCAFIKRLRYDMNSYIPVCCVSDKEDKAICNEYYIDHIIHPNTPLTGKFNRGFQYMRSLGVDYVMILGSDNIISTQLMRAIDIQAEKNISLIGIDTIHFYCGEGIDRGKLVQLSSKNLLGVAKTIHKNVLDCVSWTPFPIDKNWGIDAIGTKTIAPYVTTKVTVNGFCCDIKTRRNLNQFSVFGKRCPQVDSDVFYNILGEEEKTLIQKI